MRTTNVLLFSTAHLLTFAAALFATIDLVMALKKSRLSPSRHTGMSWFWMKPAVLSWQQPLWWNAACINYQSERSIAIPLL